jgi:hypothetical protein
MFQQDGTSAHLDSALTPFLLIDNFLISESGVEGIIWPPRSPDLTPLSIFYID